MMPTVFQFKADWFTDGRSEPLVAKAPRRWVDRFIAEEEFYELFGGYVTWRAPERSSDEMPGRAIGVWSRRKVSRFRRVLRERGAEFEVINGRGPNQALETQSTRSEAV